MRRREAGRIEGGAGEQARPSVAERGNPRWLARRLRADLRTVRTRAASGPALGVLRPLCEELADDSVDRKIRRARKRGPELGECQMAFARAASGAPGGAPPRSQEEAARLWQMVCAHCANLSAACLGWFAAAPGTDRKVPAFPGAPLPSLSGSVENKVQTSGALAPRERERLSSTHSVRFACALIRVARCHHHGGNPAMTTWTAPNDPLGAFCRENHAALKGPRHGSARGPHVRGEGCIPHRGRTYRLRPAGLAAHPPAAT